MYLYSDTDSIHTTLCLQDLEKICEIDDVKLGAWKNEGFATRAKFIRQKCYVEEFYKKVKYNGKIKHIKYKNSKILKIKGYKKYKKLKITCAGLPPRCYHNVTWENFKTGFKCNDKLTYKHVKGGVKLVETEFSIKEDKFLSK